VGAAREDAELEAYPAPARSPSASKSIGRETSVRESRYKQEKAITHDRFKEGRENRAVDYPVMMGTETRNYRSR
jgi:hypothetical protein